MLLLLSRFLFVANSWSSLLREFLLLIEGFLSTELAIKDLEHSFLLHWSRFSERFAEVHQRHGTIRVTNGSELLLNSNACKRGVTDLLIVGQLVLAVIEVPNIKNTIHAS